MDAREFQPFGASHGLAVAASLVAGIVLVRWFRCPEVSASNKLRMRRMMAVLLCVAVALDPILAWLRYQDAPATAWRLILSNSLPIHLCDVVSLLLAWALISGSQRIAETGYFWSLVGTTQGLLTPALVFDWHSPEYYGFFVQHGGAPVAAMVLVFGLGLGPQPGYFVRMLWWSWGYMLVAFALNLWLGSNYGFINGKPETASLLDRMGPWPYYLIPLQLIAFSGYLLLGWLAIRLNRRFPLPVGMKPAEFR